MIGRGQQDSVCVSFVKGERDISEKLHGDRLDRASKIASKDTCREGERGIMGWVEAVSRNEGRDKFEIRKSIFAVMTHTDFDQTVNVTFSVSTSAHSKHAENENIRYTETNTEHKQTVDKFVHILRKHDRNGGSDHKIDGI